MGISLNLFVIVLFTKAKQVLWLPCYWYSEHYETKNWQHYPIHHNKQIF
jgi:hypothetical protein